MLFENEKLIFIHIGKNAGSSIRKLLLKNFKAKALASTHAGLKEYKAEKIELDRYFKFCTVRNPYDRMWSLYSFSAIKSLNKSKPNDGERKRKDWMFWKEFTDKNYQPSLGHYSKWIQYCLSIYEKYKKIYGDKFDEMILNNNLEGINLDYDTEFCANVMHFFRTQSSFVTIDNKMRADLFLKVESINEDFKFIKSKFKIKGEPPKLNTTAEIYKNYKKTSFSDTIKNGIYRVHKKDFENFKYNK